MKTSKKTTEQEIKAKQQEKERKYEENLSRLEQLVMKAKDQNIISALTEVIQAPPYKSNNIELKNNYVKLFLSLLSKMKIQQLQDVADNLSSEQCVVILKYLYRTWEILGDGNTEIGKMCSSNTLLKMHSTIVEKHGPSTIATVLSDTNVV